MINIPLKLLEKNKYEDFWYEPAYLKQKTLHYCLKSKLHLQLFEDYVECMFTRKKTTIITQLLQLLADDSIEKFVIHYNKFLEYVINESTNKVTIFDKWYEFTKNIFVYILYEKNHILYTDFFVSLSKFLRKNSSYLYVKSFMKTINRYAVYLPNIILYKDLLDKNFIKLTTTHINNIIKNNFKLFCNIIKIPNVNKFVETNISMFYHSLKEHDFDLKTYNNIITKDKINILCTCSKQLIKDSFKIHGQEEPKEMEFDKQQKDKQMSKDVMSFLILNYVV